MQFNYDSGISRGFNCRYQVTIAGNDYRFFDLLTGTHAHKIDGHQNIDPFLAEFIADLLQFSLAKLKSG